LRGRNNIRAIITAISIIAFPEGIEKMKPVFSSLVWGTFWLLAAAFVIVSQLEGFTKIGIGSIIVTILSVALIVQCLAHLRAAPRLTLTENVSLGVVEVRYI
jgi:hypothetical protein